MEPAVSLSAVKVGDTLQVVAGGGDPRPARGRGALRDVVPHRRAPGRRGALRHRGGAPAAGPDRARGRRRGPRAERARGAHRPRGGAGLRRLRGQPGVAGPLPRAAVGPRQGAGHALQHRRRAAHGDGGGRPAPRAVDRLPLHARSTPTRPRTAIASSPTRPTASRIPTGCWSTRAGMRFFDEGEDFQFYTYAKLGGIILNEPGGIGWQIFDSKVTHLLEGRYQTGHPAGGRHPRGSRREAPARSRGVPAHARGLQRRGDAGPLRSDRPRRPRHPRARRLPSPTGPSASTPRPSWPTR